MAFSKSCLVTPAISLLPRKMTIWVPGTTRQRRKGCTGRQARAAPTRGTGVLRCPATPRPGCSKPCSPDPRLFSARAAEQPGPSARPHHSRPGCSSGQLWRPLRPPTPAPGWACSIRPTVHLEAGCWAGEQGGAALSRGAVSLLSVPLGALATSLLTRSWNFNRFKEHVAAPRFPGSL